MSAFSMAAADAPAPLGAVARLAAPEAPAGLPAWQLREELVTGRRRVPDVVAAHLERLAAVDEVLNATTAVRAREALAEARVLQDRLHAGAVPGPLFGVPFTVKDVIATAGTATTCGSAAFVDNVPVADAAAVRHLRAAGAVLIAKGNCPEFAFGVTADNPTFGITGNPWGPHSPGGSSGGDAALVAAGAAALGLGTDYGGSLRWPAQCCGVLGLRPGLHRVDGAGQLPGPGGRLDGRADGPGSSVQHHFQVLGPLARSVRDLALATAVLAGDAELAGAGVDPGAGAPVALGWVPREDSQRVGSGVAAALARAAAALSAAGLIVEPADGALDGLHEAFNALRATDPLADLRAAVGARRDRVGAAALATLDAAPVSARAPARLWAELDRLRAGVLRQLRRTPVLVAPVAPAPACDLDGGAVIDGERLAGFALMAQCRAVSALGLPALSIPIGIADGLPVSVQLIAGPGKERLVLQVAAALEHVLGPAPSPPWLS